MNDTINKKKKFYMFVNIFLLVLVILLVVISFGLQGDSKYKMRVLFRGFLGILILYNSAYLLFTNNWSFITKKNSKKERLAAGVLLGFVGLFGVVTAILGYGLNGDPRVILWRDNNRSQNINAPSYAKSIFDKSTSKESVNTDTEDSFENTTTERVVHEVVKDIDNNQIMDKIQIVEYEDGSKSYIRFYLNEQQIYEYRNDYIKFMSIDVFKYLDLDGDDINEIIVVAETNANSRPLVQLLCLKEINDLWKPLDIPLNETGNNGFSFKITRGKEEFDFIISSDDGRHVIHFDATIFFENDEFGNYGSIKDYRSNNYKEGDEVGFISAWGIWEARTGTYQGKNCIIALQGIEGPYGHGLGRINIYFAFNEQGDADILNIEYLP